jgi:hypothetical protein
VLPSHKQRSSGAAAGELPRGSHPPPTPSVACHARAAAGRGATPRAPNPSCPLLTLLVRLPSCAPPAAPPRAQPVAGARDARRSRRHLPCSTRWPSSCSTHRQRPRQRKRRSSRRTDDELVLQLRRARFFCRDFFMLQLVYTGVFTKFLACCNCSLS